MRARENEVYRRVAGFTVLELVVTLVIVGIIAASVWPRFASRETFETAGFVDQTRSAVQFARKLAVATARNVCVSASGDTLTLTMATSRGIGEACTPAVTNPATGEAYTITAPNDATYYSDSLALTFRADGSPSAADSLTVHGDSDITIQVDGVTGYVQ